METNGDYINTYIFLIHQYRKIILEKYSHSFIFGIFLLNALESPFKTGDEGPLLCG